MHPERITEKDKELVNDINYDGNDFPMVEKIFSKIGIKNNTCINVSCHENKLTFPFTSQIKNLKIQWISCL